MSFILSRIGAKNGLGAFSAGLALLLGLIVANPAVAESRVALVIGNSNYQGDLPQLPQSGERRQS